MTLEDLTVAQRAAVRAVVSARRAWSRREDLDARGHEPGTLDGLIGADWLAPWDDCPGGRAVTLTPIAAAVIETTIGERWEAETGESEVPFWMGPDDRLPRIRVPRHGGGKGLSELADPAPGPVEEAIAAEEWLMQPVMTETGQLAVDPETGRDMMEPVILFGEKIPVKRIRGKRKCG